MDLRQLEYFVAVAEELNFTRAAARCHIVQSALSYQISRLEREHGLALFERTSRSVRLAAGGEALLPRARSILAEVAVAGAELAALTGVVAGRLRLGVISSGMQAVPALERALAEFHRRHPQVDITISDTGSSDMVDQVRRGALDLAVVGLFAGQVPAELAHRVLATEPLVAVVDRSNPLAGRVSVSAAELAAGSGFVELRAESGLRRQVDAVFARAGVERRIDFELSTSENVVRFVGLGFGSAVVPRSSALGRADVAVIGMEDIDAVHPVSVVHRHPAPAAPSAQAFLALLG